MCSRSLFRYIFSPKLKGYRAVRSLSEFCLQSFFLLLLKPERKLKSDKTESRNFDFETKVRDKMPTERETYYLLLSRSIYLAGADESLRFRAPDKRARVIRSRCERGNAPPERVLCRKGGGSWGPRCKWMFSSRLLTWFTPISDALMERYLR